MKPRVFVGSSSESLDIAYAIQSNLERDVEATVWDQNVFQPGEHVLESLERQIRDSDFGVFVFSRDDVINIRNSEHVTVRDNVVFELGISVGMLGRNRSFMVTPTVESFRIPSDLLGINGATYSADRSDGDWEAALAPACSKIRKAMDTPIASPLEPRLSIPVLQRFNALSPNMSALFKYIERFEPCYPAQLKESFKQYAEGELFYRLEYLRLLSLIWIKQSKGENGRKKYLVHDAYKAEIEVHYSEFK